jgi:hypothetical protein
MSLAVYSSYNPCVTYAINRDIKPVVGSKTLFYAQVNDEATGATRVKEFYIDSEHDRKEASDITAHVPKYIPDDVVRWLALLTERCYSYFLLQVRNCMSTNTSGQEQTRYNQHGSNIHFHLGQPVKV